jgi:hypothetical protein
MLIFKVTYDYIISFWRKQNYGQSKNTRGSQRLEGWKDELAEHTEFLG